MDNRIVEFFPVCVVEVSSVEEIAFRMFLSYADDADDQSSHKTNNVCYDDAELVTYDVVVDGTVDLETPKKTADQKDCIQVKLYGVLEIV